MEGGGPELGAVGRSLPSPRGPVTPLQERLEAFPVLQHAPDFLGEAAGSVLEAWISATGSPRRLDEVLLHEQLYEWAEMVGRIERRTSRGKPAKRR